MAFSTGSSSGPAAEINVTPLIDVLLVLLIIFMVIVPLTPHGLAALLPQPTHEHTAASPEQPLVVDVGLAPGGEVVYSLNQQRMTKTALLPELSRVLRTRESKVLFVRGDPKLEFLSVAEVIGMGQQASADRIGVLTPGLQRPE